MEQAPEISMGQRILFWVTAWGIACLAALTAFPGTLALAMLGCPWLFAYGLLFIFVPRDPHRDGHYVGLVLGWLLYLGLTIFALAQRRRVRFIVAYGILCALLAFNVVGCHVQVYSIFHHRQGP